jgi:hypothetical protein
MKLRKFEIDAIVSKVLETIKDKIQIPSFKKELKERKAAINKYVLLTAKKDEIDKELNVLKKDFRINYRTDVNNLEKENASYEKELISEYKKSKLPSIECLERDIILANNKDLSELVQELIEKYT